MKKKFTFLLIPLLICVGYFSLQIRNASIWKNENNRSSNTISSISAFSLASANASDPVSAKYVSFDVQLNTDRTVLLQWKTSDEINSDHFEIERSREGNNWISLASIIPKSSHTYAYADLFPENGLNFYRIKEIDLDGKYLYSDMKFVQIGKDNEFRIWPNPARDKLFVQIPFTGANVEITDPGGRLLWKNINTSTILIIPIENLNAGIYILQVASGKEKIVQKFMKE